MEKKRYYLAYGSNCNLDQMEVRCPKAKPIEPVTLKNYSLTFNGKRNGWGVANIRRKNGTDVQGLLWDITSECEKSLDRYEGYPVLYEKKNVTVIRKDGSKVKAMVYVMTKGHEALAQPTDGYFDGILQGFMQNGMDTAKLFEALEGVKLKRRIAWA